MNHRKDDGQACVVDLGENIGTAIGDADDLARLRRSHEAELDAVRSEMAGQILAVQRAAEARAEAANLERQRLERTIGELRDEVGGLRNDLRRSEAGRSDADGRLNRDRSDREERDGPSFDDEC